MTSLPDARAQALHDLGHQGHISDMILSWLQANGATSENTPDAWREMLWVQWGQPQGLEQDQCQRNDWWFDLLGSLGHTGAMNDRELAFWTTQAGVFP